MSKELSTDVRERLRYILFQRHLTYAAAAKVLDMQATWLGRRLNGTVAITLDDVELICSRLEIPISDVIQPKVEPPLAEGA